MNRKDIEVGIVNSFAGSEIMKRIPDEIREIPRKYGEPSELPDEPRLFVCVGHQKGRSQWAEITTKNRDDKQSERLEIEREWRSWQDGGARHSSKVAWKKNDQYIHGAVFEGSDEVWASLAQDRNTQGQFKIVTSEGIQKIREHLNPQLDEPLFP